MDVWPQCKSNCRGSQQLCGCVHCQCLSQRKRTRDGYETISVNPWKKFHTKRGFKCLPRAGWRQHLTPGSSHFHLLVLISKLVPVLLANKLELWGHSCSRPGFQRLCSSWELPGALACSISSTAGHCSAGSHTAPSPPDPHAHQRQLLG